MVEPRPEILSMPEYTPGRSVAAVERELGVHGVIKLASNESLWGTSPAVIHAAAESLQRLNVYPEVIPTDLVEALARHSGFAADAILVGNGADELLRLLATAYVRPGDTVLYPHPSFAAYPYAARLMGGTPVAVPLHPEGYVDLEATADRVDASTRLIYLCSPNSPTGGIFTQSQWTLFLERVGTQALLVIDQAYREFVDDPGYARIEDAIRQGLPVVMVRTFSKLYGLAGARVGWLVADPPTVSLLHRVREPFSVNRVALSAAAAALADPPYFERVRRETLVLRRWLTAELRGRGFSVLESQANFVAFDCRRDAVEFTRRLEFHGVVVRPGTSFGLPTHCRVTVAPQPALARFFEALDAVTQQP